MVLIEEKKKRKKSQSEVISLAAKYAKSAKVIAASTAVPDGQNL